MSKHKHTPPKSKWTNFAGSDGTFDFEPLSDEQKEEFYKECEYIGGDQVGAHLTPTQRRLHERVLRSRPRQGKGG